MAVIGRLSEDSTVVSRYKYFERFKKFSVEDVGSYTGCSKEIGQKYVMFGRNQFSN